MSESVDESRKDCGWNCFKTNRKIFFFLKNLEIETVKNMHSKTSDCAETI